MFHLEWAEEAVLALTSQLSLGQPDLAKSATLAITELQSQLSSDPLHCGESRDSGRRVHVVPPLTVTFEVDEAAKRVTILHVRVFQMRRH